MNKMDEQIYINQNFQLQQLRAENMNLRNEILVLNRVIEHKKELIDKLIKHRDELQSQV